jgi:hypothetical protein
MTDWIREILNRYGQVVTIRTKDGDVTARALIQPVTERQEQEPDAVSELGALDKRLWLYLGRSAVDPEHRILWNGMEFRVRSSRPYYVGETMLYWWASLERAKEAAE